MQSPTIIYPLDDDMVDPEYVQHVDTADQSFQYYNRLPLHYKRKSLDVYSKELYHLLDREKKDWKVSVCLTIEFNCGSS